MNPTMAERDGQVGAMVKAVGSAMRGGTGRKAEGKSQKAKGKDTPSLTTPKGEGLGGRDFVVVTPHP